MSLYNTHGQKNNDQNDKRKIKNKSRKKASVKNISNIYNRVHLPLVQDRKTYSA